MVGDAPRKRSLKQHYVCYIFYAHQLGLLVKLKFTGQCLEINNLGYLSTLVSYLRILNLGPSLAATNYMPVSDAVAPPSGVILMSFCRHLRLVHSTRTEFLRCKHSHVFRSPVRLL